MGRPRPVPLGARVPGGTRSGGVSTRSSATRRSRAGRRSAGALGGQYRDYLVEWLADGARGSADLVAYFYLRAARLASCRRRVWADRDEHARAGDTREVGLDQLTGDGWTLYRAIASEPWPGGASLEMATVWARRDAWGGSQECSTAARSLASAQLWRSRSRVEGNAAAASTRIASRAFQGIVGRRHGVRARSSRKLVRCWPLDERNADVVRPYLIGEDLNRGQTARRRDGSSTSATGQSSERETIGAHSIASTARAAGASQSQASGASTTVGGSSRDAAAALPHDRAADALHRDHAVQQARCSRCRRADIGIVYLGSDRRVCVRRRRALRAAVERRPLVVGCSVASTIGAGYPVHPDDCFETFSQPNSRPPSATSEASSTRIDLRLMLDRQEGLTKTYNRVHDPDETSD